VRLVDDVDLVAAVDRREEGAFPQVAGVVDAAVAGRVDLDDVDRARAVGPCSQLSERARMRADDVLPQPRGPLNR
jgi:hypothetical protein